MIPVGLKILQMNFLIYLFNLGTLVRTMLGNILNQIDSGQPFNTDLQVLMQRINMLEQTYNNFANFNFLNTLSNIGGKADWTCYRQAIDDAIRRAVDATSVRGLKSIVVVAKFLKTRQRICNAKIYLKSGRAINVSADSHLDTVIYRDISWDGKRRRG